MNKYAGKYRIDTARAKWWDYKNEGDYFITICTKKMEHLFGHIENGEMILNQYGKVVHDCWYNLPNHFPNIVLGQFQIMPNHIHCIIGVDNTVFSKTQPNDISQTNNPVETGLVETGLRPVSTEINTKNHGIFEFIGSFKSFSSRQINKIRNTAGVSNWQSRFYDHIIRNDEEYQRIKDYIINNPKVWHKDKFNVLIDL